MRARLWLLMVLAGACAGRAPAAPPAAAPQLRALSPDARRPFVLEQRLSGRYGERDIEAHVVLQWQDGVLRLVGLAPFGARAFVVEQRGSEVKVENSLGRPLPFDPRHVLVDIQRVLFRGSPGPLPDGAHERREDGELIREQWQAGQLSERRFEPLEAGAKAVIVSFSGPAAPVVARHVRLVNQTLGYALEIETLTQQWL